VIGSRAWRLPLGDLLTAAAAAGAFALWGGTLYLLAG
jgi:hypothetical protein